jgi:proteic killer suppression protein
MIKHFRHRGLQAFFEQGSKAGIQPHHAARLARQLKHLDRSKLPADMNVPGWKLHSLKGKYSNYYSIKVDGNWRLTFKYDGQDVILLNYHDYH